MSDEQLIPTPGVFGENGNFLLERELGKGGMGGVYMGRDKMLDRPVAVKVMLKEYGSDADFVEKFKREAQAAARLIHPNIAQVYSYGIADGMPYIAMELVAGGSLYQLMENTGANSDVPRVMKICEQVAQALRCAADQGLVHGDVKPENVLLDANGNAKLVDFGLAAMQKDTNEIWGTPYYIAPEKVKKEPVDYRADMYSLGGTLYHALTGVAPFEGEDAAAVVRKRFEGAPKKPSEVRPGLSAQVDYLVMKMLAQNPQDRYPTFEALLEDFRRVMTTGLQGGMTPAQAAAAGAAAEAGRTTTGGKRLMLKPKRRLTTVRHETVRPDAEDGGDVADLSEEEMQGGRRLTARRLSNGSDGDGEENDNLGGKVALVVGGVIALVVLIVGALVWYQVADRKARAAELQAQIDRGFNQARNSLSATRTAVGKRMEEISAFADEAVKSCQKSSDKLYGILSGKYSDNVLSLLKPAPTAELLEAIASTNAAPAAPAGEAPKAAAPAAAAPAAKPAAAPVVVAAAPVPRFRPPNDDEADPASPEHEAYMKEKAKWEAEQKAKAAAEAAKPKAERAPAPAAVAVASDGKREEIPGVVKDVNGLWEKAYSCQACAIRIRKQCVDLLAEIDEAEKITGSDEPTMRKIVDAANMIKDKFEAIKASKDVETIQKAKGFITDRGGKYIEQTIRRLREEAAQAEREADRLRREKEEKERLERLARERAEKVENETKAAKDAFQKTIDNGNLRLLDWAGAKRIIKTARDGMDTSEGQIQADKEIKKVEAMELVQTAIQRNLKDYVFMKAKLRGAVVVEVDDKEIVYLPKKDAKKQIHLAWVKFYSGFHGNLNELINKFVKNGRMYGEPKLNLKEWADAMMGVALTMRIVCSDDPMAAAFGEQMAKEAVKQFPNFLKQAKEFFPDLDFSDVEAAAAADVTM